MPTTTTTTNRRAQRTRRAVERPEKGHGRALAYDWLKARIVSLELAPGSTIDEAALVGRLGVSRTPLREAIVRLGAEGLVELLPNRGARVASMDLPRLQEHLEAFELMQRAATVLATQHRSEADVATLKALCEVFETAATADDAQAMIDANWEFHRAIALACGNRYIESMYTALLTEGLRIARLAMAYECYGSADAYRSHVGDILREHRELVDVIRRRDLARASTLADSHSDLARRRVTAYLSRSVTATIAVQPRARVRSTKAA